MPTRPGKSASLPERTNLLAFVTAGATVLAIIVAAAPVYWSYLCRSSGQFCEGSVAAPIITSQNTDTLNKRLATVEGKASFDGLLVEKRGNWIFGSRYDVTARFKDGSSLVVDTMPDDFNTIEVVNDNSDKMSAVVASGSDIDDLSLITAYFTEERLVKRVFVFSCGGSGGVQSKYITLRNLDYSLKVRRLTSDISTSCKSISVNSATQLELAEYASQDGPYGYNVILQLTESAHLDAMYTKKAEEEFKKSEQKYVECLNGITAASQKLDGEVWACYKYRSYIDTKNISVLKVFEWSNGELKEIGSRHCQDGVYWTGGSNRKAIFASCSSRSYGEHPVSSLDISIFNKPFDRENYFSFEGACNELNAWNMQFVGQGDSSIKFEFVTNCSEIAINDIKFPVDLGDAGIIRKMYRLGIDEDGLVATLEPLVKSAIWHTERQP